MKGSFHATNQSSSLYFHESQKKNCTYSKHDWNPWDPLIFPLMHQSFGLNKLAGLRILLICHTQKHISRPQNELFNELFIIILDWSCAQRTGSINDELPAPPLRSWESSQNNWTVVFWRDSGLRLQSHCTERKDKRGWPRWSMRTRLCFVCRRSLIGTNKPSKDVRFHFRRVEFYWFYFKNVVIFFLFFYVFSNKI